MHCFIHHYNGPGKRMPLRDDGALQEVTLCFHPLFFLIQVKLAIRIPLMGSWLPIMFISFSLHLD